jgi:hypothetical protein
VFAQIVTLYLTPVFYTYMDSLQNYLGRGARKTFAQPTLQEPVLTEHSQHVGD